MIDPTGPSTHTKGNTMQLRDIPEYETTLRRYCVLIKVRDAGELTPEQANELAQANAKLSGIEADYYRSMRRLVNDYDQLAVIGDLGGTEIL